MQMKKIVLLIAIGLCQSVFASDKTKLTRAEYIQKYKDDAIRDMLKTGVPASITLAQACLESHDGHSALARKANNHFGIKCSDWTGPYFIQDDDTKDECFRKYNTPLESYDDHSMFLKTRPRYASLFQLEITDYKGWAHGLKKAGYATDPSYATRLIKIIEDNQLYLLDQSKEVQYIASIDTKSVGSDERGTSKKVYVPSVEAVDAFTSRKILSKNGLEYLVVRKGDSFKSLAKEMHLGYWQLPKYNEMKEDAEISEGQILYLKPKKKEGLIASYIVKPGDTPLTIAQENGMKVKYIYKYNDISPNAPLEPGQQILLKEPQ
jgi:LysM repeat protein